MIRGFLFRLHNVMLLAAAMLLISSCATLSSNGVGRVRHYTVVSEQLPPSFDGYRIAFVSDLHYPSLFGSKRLPKLVACLNEISPDILMLGGDYVTDNDSIGALFLALGSVDARDGKYAVPGNHEWSNSLQVMFAMEENGIELLDDEIRVIQRGEESILVAGVADSFNDRAVSPLGESVDSDKFVILLSHNPDYAEFTLTSADLVLSGHTHGGQVSLFGLYTPVKNSTYGTRFLRGKNVTSAGAMVITTNGVGTSRRKVRFCVPSEVVVVTLKRE